MSTHSRKPLAAEPWVTELDSQFGWREGVYAAAQPRLLPATLHPWVLAAMGAERFGHEPALVQPIAASGYANTAGRGTRRSSSLMGPSLRSPCHPLESERLYGPPSQQLRLRHVPPHLCDPYRYEHGGLPIIGDPQYPNVIDVAQTSFR